MKRIPEELLLNDSYNLQVIISTQGGTFAGELSLTPKKITLLITGDEHENRSCDLLTRHDDNGIDSLTCTYMNATYLLLNLKLIRHGYTFLSHDLYPTRHIAIIFEVEYVIYCQYGNDFPFYRFEIHSPTLHSWIGRTHTQERLLGNYLKGNLLNSDDTSNVEFNTDIDEVGSIGVYYATTCGQLDTLAVGITLQPIFYIQYAQSILPSMVLHLYTEIYSLLSMLIGDELYIDKIHIVSTCPFPNRHASLYYATESIPKPYANSLIMFPLANAVVLNDLCLPELPISIFANIMLLMPPKEHMYRNTSGTDA